LTEELAAQLAKASPRELAELGRALDLLQRTFAALEEQSRGPVEMRAGDDLPVWDGDGASEEATAVVGATSARSDRTATAPKRTARPH
jgi:hypothetical protein